MPTLKAAKSTALIPAEQWARSVTATGQLTHKSLVKSFADCQANALRWAGFVKADTTAKCGPTLGAAFGKELDKLSNADIEFVRQAYAHPHIKTMVQMLRAPDRRMVLRMLVGIRRAQSARKKTT